jgi:hypothetical protein
MTTIIIRTFLLTSSVASHCFDEKLGSVVNMHLSKGQWNVIIFLNLPQLPTYPIPPSPNLSTHIPSPILRAPRRQQAHSLRQTLTIVVPTNRTLQLRLLNISRKIKVIPHTGQVVKTRRRDVVRRLPVNQESVPVRGDGQWGWGHVRSDGLALLRGDALGLHVGDDPVEEICEDGCSRAGSIGVDHDEGVFGCGGGEAEFGGDVEGRLGEGF